MLSNYTRACSRHESVLILFHNVKMSSQITPDATRFLSFMSNSTFSILHSLVSANSPCVPDRPQLNCQLSSNKTRRFVLCDCTIAQVSINTASLVCTVCIIYLKEIIWQHSSFDFAPFVFCCYWWNYLALTLSAALLHNATAVAASEAISWL